MSEEKTAIGEMSGEEVEAGSVGEDAHAVPSEEGANLAAIASPRPAVLQRDAAEAMVERLADEYLALVEELPEVGAFDALPPSVLAEAAEGRSLAEAYFRYAYREKCRIEDERERQSAARAAATGSLAGSAVDGGSAAERAMLKGIWGERL